MLSAFERCDDDCTFTDDDICHVECYEIGRCEYHDTTARDRCAEKSKDWVVSYDATHSIICCEGTPFEEEKLKIAAVNSTGITNIMRQTRIVMYRGKPVKLVVDVFN